MNRRSPIAIALLLAACSPSCGGPRENKLVLQEVRATAQVIVFEQRRGDSKQLPAGQFRDQVLERLSKLRHVSVEPSAEPAGARLRVEAMLEMDLDTHEGRAVVAMRTDRERVPITVTVLQQGRVRGTDDRVLLDAAVAAAVRGLEAQARIVVGGDRQVLAAMDAHDEDVRILAARVAASRRIRGTAERAVKMLASPRQEVRDAAIGVLVELRDPSAVRPLIDSARTDDPQAQLRIVEALSAIGGDEAAQYLELLASGSEEPDIRAAAARARERLATRSR